MTTTSTLMGGQTRLGLCSGAACPPILHLERLGALSPLNFWPNPSGWGLADAMKFSAEVRKNPRTIPALVGAYGDMRDAGTLSGEGYEILANSAWALNQPECLLLECNYSWDMLRPHLNEKNVRTVADVVQLSADIRDGLTRAQVRVGSLNDSQRQTSKALDSEISEREEALAYLDGLVPSLIAAGFEVPYAVQESATHPSLSVTTMSRINPAGVARLGA